MMTRRLAVASLVISLLGCGGPKGPFNVPLQWKPTDDLSPTMNGLSRALKNQRVQLTTFTDQRDPKTLIGRNIEKADRPVDVVTPDDVGVWSTNQMKDLLKKAGVEVVDARGTLVLGGKINEFFVNEGNTYEGKVALQLTVASAAGKELWNGTVAGRSKQWGGSLSEDNYREAISNAYAKAMQELLKDDAFLAAVRSRG